jgi:hypothetical protein
MPVVNFKLHSTLAPDAVMAALTDFGPGRAEVWPNVDSAHFKVHDQGPGWADVTEGSSVAGGVWERERYSWDVASGTVAIETLPPPTEARRSRSPSHATAKAGRAESSAQVFRLPALPCFARR